MNRPPWFRDAVARTAAALLAMPLAGCGSREGPEPVDARPDAVTAVSVHRVASGAGSRSVVLPGRIAAREEVLVRATLAAQLSSLPYAEGREFPRGATLALFEAPEAVASLRAAGAAVHAAEHRLALARRQEERLDSLYAQRVAALRELELAQAERRAAEAAAAGAEAALESLRSGTRVRAPFSGVVVRHRLDPGATVAPGDPVLEIRSREAGDIVAAVPEGWLSDLVGGDLHVRIGSGPWRPARLLRVEGMIDPATRTRTARLRHAERQERLEPGAFVQVRLQARSKSGDESRPEAMRVMPSGPLAIPSRAVFRRGSLTGVYLAREGTAWLRWIRTGRADSAQTEVLAGLEPGDLVILDPAPLSDGMRVAVRP